jgi:hypothetical protein
VEGAVAAAGEEKLALAVEWTSGSTNNCVSRGQSRSVTRNRVGLMIGPPAGASESVRHGPSLPCRCHGGEINGG